MVESKRQPKVPKVEKENPILPMLCRNNKKSKRKKSNTNMPGSNRAKDCSDEDKPGWAKSTASVIKSSFTTLWTNSDDPRCIWSRGNTKSPNQARLRMNGMLSTHMKSNMGTGDSGRAKLLPASLSVGRKRDPASPFHWGNGGINMNQHESTWINMNQHE